MSNNLPYYLGFSHCLGIGPMRFKNLVDTFGSVKAAYEADKASIQESIGIDIGNKFAEFRAKFNPSEKIEEIKKNNIHIITREDLAFPRQLYNLSDPPICLYTKGDFESMDFEKEIF